MGHADTWRTISTSRSLGQWNNYPWKLLQRRFIQWRCTVGASRARWIVGNYKYGLSTATRLQFRWESMLCKRLGKRYLGQRGQISSHSKENRSTNRYVFSMSMVLFGAFFVCVWEILQFWVLFLFLFPLFLKQIHSTTAAMCGEIAPNSAGSTF